jgi:DNA polymerase III subunit delta
MSFKAFLSEVEKGLPKPFYLFFTEDPFLQREAVEAIKRLVPETERDFNLHVFDLLPSGDVNLSFGEIINVANTVSFFGGRRFTIVTGNIQKLPKKELEKLNDYASNPAEGSVFLVIHQGVFSKEGREKFRNLKPVALDIRETEIPYWMKKRAEIKGIDLSNDAIDYLIGLIGPDLGLLSSEIEKISLLGGKSIGVKDIADIVTGGRLYGIFDLVNALRQQDADKVFRIYRSLRETAEDYSLIGALNWQYGRNLQPQSDRAQKDYFLQVFELLNSTDIDIKSSGRVFPIEYLLFRLLKLRAG